MLPTSQITQTIGGVQTEVVLQSFADRILVVITQLGKVGNLIEARMPDAEPLLPALAPPEGATEVPLPPPPPSIQLTPLFGNAPTEDIQTLHSLYAAQVATLIWTEEAEGGMGQERRPVIIGIALKKTGGDGGHEGLSEYDRMVFREVMSMTRSLAARK